MKLHSGAALFLLLLAAACWFGSRLGPLAPRDKTFPPPPDAAITAAIGFVQEAADAKRKLEGRGPLMAPFEPGTTATQDAQDADLWTVRGTTAPDVEDIEPALSWRVVERWTGNGFKAKVVEVWRARPQKEEQP